MTQSFVLQNIEQHVGIITLNNPDKCNAINPDLIIAFQEQFHALLDNNNVHVILIHGNGKHFCAGADLAHMKKMAAASESENERDALWLTQLFQLIDNSKKTTICYAHGHTYGGGLGILSASDIVIADQRAQFCFPEVKIGLIPATIAPFVVRRIGYQSAKYHMLTAEKFNAQIALQIQLIDQVTTDGLDTALSLATQISSHNSNALYKTKQWLHTLHPLDKCQIEESAHLLAQIRAQHLKT